MKTDELRKTYLDFFKKKDHRAFSSDSLVPPGEDKSLLFTGAGMNQFKPYFLGLKKDVKRATSCQKCLRTADLDRVGKTAYHHSFFEMLGNFSFGDYFKEEAIAWGWEFVTKALGLPPGKLWVSVYEQDDEAYNIWKDKIHVPESRIVRMGAEDNFWPSNAPKDGPNGPCGPCSEIYVGETPGKGVEIWNLVFTQFDRQSDGSLKPLPQKNIDTGMGLERTAAVLQGAQSNFDTDNFQKIRAELKRLLKTGSNEIAHENAMMDHIRAVVFSIADGALPSNEGRGYVIRKMIRLASDHLTKAGAVNSETLSKLVPVIVDVYGKTYPEIFDRQAMITTILDNEEKNFKNLIDQKFGQLVNEYHELQRRYTNMDILMEQQAELGFKYYDSYGMPLDLVKAATQESGLMFNETLFDKHMEEQRRRSRAHSKIAGEIFAKNETEEVTKDLDPTIFVGYETTETKANLMLVMPHTLKSHEQLRNLNRELNQGEEGHLIFDKTSFYAEAGGQIADLGEIISKDLKAQVLDVQRAGQVVLHRVKVISGHASRGKSYSLIVDKDRRADIMKNHTATHLLHAALRKVLGDHVKQSGSLVAPDRLRFDFTHFSALDLKSINAVEELVNAEIRKNIALDKTEMSKEEAMKGGAIAFFGEKYGDKVRVVSVGDFSKELCGGTHLNATGEISLFKIVSESSIQAGVRRIEAVTGRGAKLFLENKENEIKLLSEEFDCDSDSLLQVIKDKKSGLNFLNSKLSKIISRLENERTKADLENLTEKYNGISIISRFNDKVRSDMFSLSISYLKTLTIPFVALFEGPVDGKVIFAVGASSDLVQKGFHAGRLVKVISEIAGGNGGGKPDYALGGGKDASKAKEAFDYGKKVIREELTALFAGNRK